MVNQSSLEQVRVSLRASCSTPNHRDIRTVLETAVVFLASTSRILLVHRNPDSFPNYWIERDSMKMAPGPFTCTVHGFSIIKNLIFQEGTILNSVEEWACRVTDLAVLCRR